MRPRHLIALVAAVACATGGWLLIRADRPDAPPAALSLADLHRLPPLYDVLYHRPDDQQALQRAMDVLMAECMARAGYTYRKDDLRSALDGDALGPRPFGREQLADVQASETPMPPEQTGPEIEGYGRALNGDGGERIRVAGRTIAVSIPTTGCRAEAEVRIAGNNRVPLQEGRIALFDAEGESLKRLAADAEYATVRADWAACMQAAGITATDPATLPASEGVEPARDPATHADLSCKAGTDFLARAYPRIAAVQNAILAEQPGMLERWTRMRAGQIEAARAILKS